MKKTVLVKNLFIRFLPSQLGAGGLGRHGMSPKGSLEGSCVSDLQGWGNPRCQAQPHPLAAGLPQELIHVSQACGEPIWMSDLPVTPFTPFTGHQEQKACTRDWVLGVPLSPHHFPVSVARYLAEMNWTVLKMEFGA